MSIDQLIQAAEWLERRDRESEHGYASTQPIPSDFTRRRIKNKKYSSSRIDLNSSPIRTRHNSISNKQNLNDRSTHNELEKNRRAHLRHCLEGLKAIVPLGSDSSRHTTLGLLTKARNFIKLLEERERKNRVMVEQLNRERRFLNRRLESVLKGQYRDRPERSYSECSSSCSSLTSSSLSEPSEADEVDVIGSGSNSDTDDHSSINSDNGYAMIARKLKIS